MKTVNIEPNTTSLAYFCVRELLNKVNKGTQDKGAICSNLENVLCNLEVHFSCITGIDLTDTSSYYFTDLADKYDELFSDWEYFSGNVVYPIGNGEEDFEEDMWPSFGWNRPAGFWKGKRGKLRKNLLNFMLEELELEMLGE